MPRAKQRKTDPHAVITELGRLVIVWNGVESAMKGVLRSLSKDPKFVHVLTVHMSTTACCDAVRVWANDHAEEAERDRLLHAIAFFEIVREYRNHYVHGMIGVAGSSDDAFTEASVVAPGPPVTRKTTARKKLQTFTRPLKLSDLRAIRKQAAVLLMFLLSIEHHFLLASIDDEQVKVPPPPLPDKPPLPDRLQMPLHSGNTG